MIINRNTNKIGGNRFLVYSSPMNYKDEFGNFHPIDLTPIYSVISSKNTTLYKSVMSVGVREEAEKLFGIRPDETQALNTESVEMSLEEVRLNGDLRTIDPDCLIVKPNKYTVRHMVKVDRPMYDFKIQYKLHLKGFTVENELKDVDYTLRKAVTAPKITNIGEVTGLEFDKAVREFEGGILIAKVIDNHVLISCENRPDEFKTTEGFTFSQATFHGASMLIKDNIMIYTKNVDNYDERILRIIGHLTGTKQADDFPNYFHSDKGKVAAYDFNWYFINTSDLTELGQSLFAQKDFTDVSFIPFDYATFVKDFSAEINSHICDSIQIKGKYYVPHASGCFFLKSDSATYRLVTPQLLDKDFKVLGADSIHVLPPTNLHTLTPNEDGTFTYTKYAGERIVRRGFYDVAYIDTTYNTTTADGFVNLNGSPWATVHDATDGNSVDNTGDYITVTALLIKSSYIIKRGFLYFDTSAIDDGATVSAVDLYLKSTASSSYNENVAMKGTQADTLTTADYDAFSGSSYGSYTYSAENQWGPISFNATGCSEINKTGTTKICVRDKPYDYDNSTPGSHTMNFFSYDEDNNIPYLDITTGGAPPASTAFMTTNKGWW